MRAATTATAWVWCVCGMLLLASALNYMDRQALANVAPRILAELGFDERRYGWLELGFGWAFAAGAIVFGVLADRLDIRLLYPAVLAAWSAVGFATVIWLATSPFHVVFGGHVQRTGDYDTALAAAGLLPLVAAVVLWAAWPRGAAAPPHAAAPHRT